MTKYLLNCDADEIIYRAAFAVETTAYRLIVKGKEYNFGTNYTREQIIQYYGLQGKAHKVDYEIQSYKVPRGPAAFAIKCCKNILTHLESIGDVKLWVTSDDKTNFRFSVAKTEGPNGVGYKAGRPPRPLYYKEVREFMESRGAEEVTGMEADDALGIHQTERTVAVHQDKDINRITGKHYNFVTGERYVVEHPGKIWLDEKRRLKGHGNAFFFAQMLMGDRVDNIPTILGYSAAVQVYDMLKGCKTIPEYFSIVEECFFNHHGRDYTEIMYETADLLYIMDSEQIRGNEYLRRMK